MVNRQGGEEDMPVVIGPFHQDNRLVSLPPTDPHGRSYGNISVSGSGLTINGDVHHHNIPFNQHQQREDVVPLGFCIGAAPQIDPNHFVGRDAEIGRISQILQPETTCTKQRRLALGGMGGVGKTQLAIAYAERYRHHHDSIFWLNATSELTLRASCRLLAGRLIHAQDLENLNDDQILLRIHEWLSDTRNTRWLLIFDNYDEPEQFNISKYCPYAAHGSIIITSRLPDLIPFSCCQVRVKPLTDVEESLDILRTRSRRENVRNDLDARRLAERLDGLPLALATAGAYLSKSASTTFQEYLQIYDQRWHVYPQRQFRLQDYHWDRTLYTTWNVSYTRLETDDPQATRVLKLLAYFDNQDIWYELLRAGVTDDLPAWLQELCTERANFAGAMSTLVDYCLVDVQPDTRSYSMHSCVHDWALAELNQVVDPQLYWYALKCVAASIKEDDQNFLGQLCYARLNRHAVRSTHFRFSENALMHVSDLDRLNDMIWLADLLKDQGQYSAAELMYTRVLARRKVLWPCYALILSAVNNLGSLYHDQGKLNEAEQIYARALAECEKVLGPDHISTLGTVNNLANLYCDRGKLDEAEQMYTRALVGCEKILGPNHTSTLSTVNNLASLYCDQGKLDEAEQMYTRALIGCEKGLGPNHTLTLGTVNNLGSLYRDQGKPDEAEQMYTRALVGYEKVLGPNHTSTLNAKHCLTNLHRDQGKLEEAEQTYQRLLAAYEKAVGHDHPSTILLVHNVCLLYADQDRLEEAEQMCGQALASYESRLGRSPARTRNIMGKLAEYFPYFFFFVFGVIAAVVCRISAFRKSGWEL